MLGFVDADLYSTVKYLLYELVTWIGEYSLYLLIIPVNVIPDKAIVSIDSWTFQMKELKFSTIIYNKN